MKFLLLSILIFAFASCKKDETKCFMCTLSQKDPAAPYGRTLQSQKRCDLTQKQADAEYKEVKIGTDTTQITFCTEL